MLIKNPAYFKQGFQTTKSILIKNQNFPFALAIVHPNFDMSAPTV